MPGSSLLFAEIREAYRRHGRTLRHMGFWAMAIYHYGRWAQALNASLARALAGKLYGLLSFLLELVSGVLVPREATIGRDLHLVHGWNIKIHARAVIGARVGIMHDVTLGTTPDDKGVPVIGDDVFIGTGAKVLGSVKIGNSVRIAANSLVISDVPDGATAIGVPARIMRYTGRAARTPAELD